MDCCRKAEPVCKDAAWGLLFHPDPTLAGGYFIKCWLATSGHRKWGGVWLFHLQHLHLLRVQTCQDKLAASRAMEFSLGWFAEPIYLGDSRGQLLESAQLVPLMTLVNCLCLKELHFTSFQLKGLSKVHERSLQRSVSRHKKCQTLVSW